MSYTLRLLTEESRDLVVEALRAEASKRTRVASKASLSVAADKLAKRDVRSAAVRVTGLLAEAAQLEQLADQLAAAPDVHVVTRAVGVDPVQGDATGIVVAEEHADPATEEELEQPADDGLSPAAHAAMAAAEQFAAEELAPDPDEADVDTGADPEDEPADDDVEDVVR